MEQVGITTDGKMVMSGVAKLYFEQGLPLSIIFDQLIKNNMIPSWPRLYNDLRDNGMTHKRIIHLLHEQVFESYGKDFRDLVISRLERAAKAEGGGD